MESRKISTKLDYFKQILCFSTISNEMQDTTYIYIIHVPSEMRRKKMTIKNKILAAMPATTQWQWYYMSFIFIVDYFIYILLAIFAVAVENTTKEGVAAKPPVHNDW